MGKALRWLLVFAFVFTAIGVGQPQIAHAQTAFPAYTSSIQVANLSSTTANITITAYNADGSKNGTDLADTIPADGSKAYFPISNVQAGFNGAIVVSSSQSIAAISNIVVSPDLRAGASYVGRDSGGTTVLLPLLNKNNSGFNTWFSVQNAGTAAANVTVKYSDGTEATGTIPVGAAKVFNQGSETHSQAVFAGTITSNQPVVDFRAASPFPRVDNKLWFSFVNRIRFERIVDNVFLRLLNTSFVDPIDLFTRKRCG